MCTCGLLSVTNTQESCNLRCLVEEPLVFRVSNINDRRSSSGSKSIPAVESQNKGYAGKSNHVRAELPLRYFYAAREEILLIIGTGQLWDADSTELTVKDRNSARVSADASYGQEKIGIPGIRRGSEMWTKDGAISRSWQAFRNHITNLKCEFP